MLEIRWKTVYENIIISKNQTNHNINEFLFLTETKIIGDRYMTM